MDVVSVLVEASDHGVRKADVDGATPMHRAAARGYAEIVELLFQKGADILAADSNGQTPLVGFSHFVINT